jgi:hypothetical protein
MSALGQKRTFRGAIAMSAQKRTFIFGPLSLSQPLATRLQKTSPPKGAHLSDAKSRPSNHRIDGYPMDPPLRVSGSNAQDWLKPAITLSRKNWLFCAIGAVLHSIPGDRRASGSCPAGSMAEVGLRWWRRRTPLNRRGDPDVNAKVEAPDPSTAK